MPKERFQQSKPAINNESSGFCHVSRHVLQLIHTPNDYNYRTSSNQASKTVSSQDYKLKIYHLINNVTTAFSHLREVGIWSATPKRVR